MSDIHTRVNPFQRSVVPTLLAVVHISGRLCLQPPREDALRLMDLRLV